MPYAQVIDVTHQFFTGHVTRETSLVRKVVMTESPSWDEEEELAEFVPPEAGPEARSQQLLTRLLQTLDHPTYRSMAPGKQQLYLQLLRWSHGEGKDALEASRVQMSLWTGLAWDTIKKYMPRLMEDHLVQLVRPATSISPAMYEVYWLPPPLALDPDTPPQTMGCYVDQFTKEDRAEYQRLSRLLTGNERQQLQSEIAWSLRDLGIPCRLEN